ncbi:MAG: hypothetical protein ABW208_01705 [Pyrinomonadaceae bacterium]
MKPLLYNHSAVGLTRGQGARLSVVYTDLPPGPCTPVGLPPGPCTPPDSFRATLSFMDDLGNVVAERSLTLTQGRAISLVYVPSSYRADGRAMTRAAVRVEPEAGYLPLIIPTVEVSEITSGQTSIFNPGWRVGFNPQPEPPGDFHFGILNIVRGQTTRVNVSNIGAPNGLPPGPCRADVVFYDGAGQSVARETLWLAPGQTGMADFATTGMPEGWRGRIRASVHVESLDGRTQPVVTSSLEVFAADTGRGVLFYPGALIGLL